MKYIWLFLLLFPILVFGQYDKYGEGYNKYQLYGSDTTVTVSDTIPTFDNLIVAFDSLGLDSTEWAATVWDTNFVNYWIGFDDTARTTAADTANCDSLYYAGIADSSTGRNVPHGLTATGSYYYLLVGVRGVTEVVKSGSTVIPEMWDPTYVATGVVNDSTRHQITANDAPDDSMMVRDSLGLIAPVDTTEGRLVLDWVDYANLDTTLLDTGLTSSSTNIAYAVFTKAAGYSASDTAAVPHDDTAPILAATVTADTNGTDSVDVVIAGSPNESGMGYFHGMSYSSITPDTTTFGDSTITGADSLTNKTWAQVVTWDTTLYFYYAVKDSNNNVSNWIADTLVIPDMWPPVVGTITSVEFVPPNNFKIAATASDSTDVTAMRIKAKTETGNSLLTLYNSTNVNIDSSFSIVQLISYSALDSIFVQAEWYDGNNTVYAYDTTGVLTTYYTFTTDTTDSTSTFSWVQFQIEQSDSTGSGDSTMWLASEDSSGNGADSLDWYLADTLISQHDPSDSLVYTRAKPWWGNIEGSWSSWVEIDETSDTTPPDSVDTFIATGESLGKDTLQTIIAGYNNPASNDSGWIFYKTGSAASTVADSTGLIRPKFAVADSATNDTIDYAIDWPDDADIWVYFVQEDSLDNIQSIAQANKDTAAVDSTGTLGCDDDAGITGEGLSSGSGYDGDIVIVEFQAQCAGSPDSLYNYTGNVIDAGYDEIKYSVYASDSPSSSGGDPTGNPLISAVTLTNAAAENSDAGDFDTSKWYRWDISGSGLSLTADAWYFLAVQFEGDRNRRYTTWDGSTGGVNNGPAVLFNNADGGAFPEPASFSASGDIVFCIYLRWGTGTP